MNAKAQEHKVEQIDKVADHCRKKLGKKKVADIAAFVRLFTDRMDPEEVLAFSVENLYGACFSLWRFTATRKANEAKVRLYNPRIEEGGWYSGHTVVEVITDDMPFLVDSVVSAISAAGLSIHGLVHPVAQCSRDGRGNRLASDAESKGEPYTESLMQILIDEQSDPTVLDALSASISASVADVRAAVDDWRLMLAKVDETLAELENGTLPLEAEEIEEGKALLRWMAENHFTFLGYREYVYDDGSGKKKGRASKSRESLSIIDGSGLGILNDPKKRVLRRGGESTAMSPELRDFFHRPELVIITKAASRSTVHRSVHLDYVGIKRYGADGKVVGERRFVGLWTSSAYTRTPREIPYLRRKIEHTIARSGVVPGSHDGKALLNILETYPRDELFQVPAEELYDTALGILGLEERPRIRLFVRQDRFERFFSCLVFVPRERYTTDLRKAYEKILSRELKGRASAFYTQVGDHPLARIHYIIGTEPGSNAEWSDLEIETKLVAAARIWDDTLQETLIDRFGEERGNRYWHKFGGMFPTSYKESFNAQVALFDIEKIEGFESRGDVALNIYRLIEDEESAVRLKVYHAGDPIPLSDCLPMMEHMGLRVMEEHPYRIGNDAGETACWIHDFSMVDRSGAELDLAAVKSKFEEALLKVWRSEMEDDGFNQLVLRAGIGWRDVVMLRSYCKYLRQTGIAFSQDYMEDTLAANLALSRLLCQLFDVRFNPDGGKKRDKQAAALVAEYRAALDQVASLDEDRILRRFLNVVQSTLRTNFYQHDGTGAIKSYIAFKLDSTMITDLPLPRPFREIFVYSPRVEGVHLRGGRVARGGLRWSDRREDFRTEVLGLMKAQMVKNAVIVPVGSKGGFVPKRLPTDGDRDAWLQEGIACYKIFISGLLDVTDNLVGDGVVPPADVVRYDEDDPYLVVAADKGTATFSDIANEVAESYGFWLGDAFASGGAAGYDHKKMAITARGAWESVMRHFREMGRDIQSEDFTVVGCGDMSGDVFGNGMLLSRHIRLLAAFDHRHIFVDPNPEAESSWQERQRLFDLPRSSWEDYDPGLISPGGGVFDRRAKSVSLTPEIREALSIETEEMTPTDFISAILRAEADLLWFGGIGTYIKASTETHAEAGDRGNDALRVNANELRCRVIGEGANLGLTQLARIEFSLKGGQSNCDFVDNSAGVDCSDHEVNIKILLNAIVSDGEMTRKQRDRLLADMTDEVGLLVLHDNYLQTQALSVAEASGREATAILTRFMRDQEKSGRLNREIEFLPNEETIGDRIAAGQGFSRPELCVLLAYAKMDLYDELLESELPDDPYLEQDLIKYFPRPLRKAHTEVIGRHKLRREIIATFLANLVVNRGGITFVNDLKEETSAPASAIVRAVAVTREAFELRSLWLEIQSLDNVVPSSTQIEMLETIQVLLKRGTLWFLRHGPRPLDIAQTNADFQPGIRELGDGMDDLLGALERQNMERAFQSLRDQGVPEGLARRVAVLEPLGCSLDIAQAARETSRGVSDVGGVYFAIGARLGLDWLRSQADRIQAENNWERMAVTAMVDDMYGQQRALTNRVLLVSNGMMGETAIDNWAKGESRGVSRSSQLIADFRTSGDLDVAKLAIANQYIGGMINR